MSSTRAALASTQAVSPVLSSLIMGETLPGPCFGRVRTALGLGYRALRVCFVDRVRYVEAMAPRSATRVSGCSRARVPYRSH